MTERIAFYLVVCIVIGTAAVPQKIRTDPTVLITGEFFKDGSCRVAADGVGLYAPAENPRRVFRAAFASSVAPDGYVYELYCSTLSHNEPNLSANRLFMFKIGAKKSGPLPTGTYTVRPDAWQDAVPLTIDAIYTDGKRTPDAFSQLISHTAILIGVSGTASFSRLDSAAVVGTFQFQAVVLRAR